VSYIVTSSVECKYIFTRTHVCLKFYGGRSRRRREAGSRYGAVLTNVASTRVSLRRVHPVQFRESLNERANMDSSSHLALIIDLSPSQWHLSAHSDLHPLSFQTFLSHVLTLLNSHIAAKHENTLAVFGALPGKRCALPHKIVAAPSTKSVISAPCSTPP